MPDPRYRSNDDGRPIHSVQRVLGRLTIGTVKDREAQVARTADSKLREELFEFQLAFAGNANDHIGWQPARCVFPAPMVSAPLQRDVDLDAPQFWSGYQLYSSSAPVVMVAYVQDWDTDDSDYFTGASCQIGAYVPGGVEDVEFAGIVHLTFQGYSGPILEDDDQGAT